MAYSPVTQEEQEILVEFRNRISDLGLDEVENSDLHLIKWPRARNYDLDRAERMIRKSWEWRKGIGYDNLLSWSPPPNYDLYFPYEISGYDNYGCAVIIVPPCEWDFYSKKELAEGRKHLIHRFVAQVTAKIMKDAKDRTDMSKGNVISQCVVCFDLSGFSMRHLTSVAVPDVLLECFRNFERNFPESLRIAYVINAPSLFALLFPLVKKFLAAKTIGKIELYDGNEIKWKNALLKDISPDQLPFKYGGLLPDRLQKKIDAAKLVTLASSWSLGTNGISIDALNTVTIQAGTKLNFDYDIKDTHVKLSWIFKTDSYDIGFGISHSGCDVLEKQRLIGNRVHEGSFICTNLGKYTVTFDNTYSLFRSKTLYYLITVEDSKYPNQLI